MAVLASLLMGEPNLPTNVYFTTDVPVKLPSPPKKPNNVVQIQHEIESFPKSVTISPLLPIANTIEPHHRLLFVNHPIFRDPPIFSIGKVFSGCWMMKSNLIWNGGQFHSLSSFIRRPQLPPCEYRLYYNTETTTAIRFIIYRSATNNVFVLIDAYVKIIKTREKRTTREYPFQHRFIIEHQPILPLPPPPQMVVNTDHVPSVDEQILILKNEIDILRHKIIIKQIKIQTLNNTRPSKRHCSCMLDNTPITEPIQEPTLPTPQPTLDQPPPPTPNQTPYPFSPFSPMPQYDDYLFSYE